METERERETEKESTPWPCGHIMIIREDVKMPDGTVTES